MNNEIKKIDYKSSIGAAIVFLIVFLGLHLTNWFQSGQTSKQIMAPENIYWLFSSSAQAISTFIAFLLTGFALVYTMMDNIQQKDDTLEEIHSKLMRIYYDRIKVLSFFTGLSIILSLLMVYLNGVPFIYNSFLIVFTSVINVAVIIGGILFVVSIINPDKYRKVARELIEDNKINYESTGNSIQEVDFIKEFIKLETTIRALLTKRKLYNRGSTIPRMTYSVRQMIESLYHAEIIDQKFYNDLIEINKYRNLVFHGHQTKVDKGMLDKVISIKEKIENLK